MDTKRLVWLIYLKSFLALAGQVKILGGIFSNSRYCSAPSENAWLLVSKKWRGARSDATCGLDGGRGESRPSLSILKGFFLLLWFVCTSSGAFLYQKAPAKAFL